MANFKQQCMACLPYVLVGIGLLLIFVWARLRQPSAEGFEDNGMDASYVSTSPYKFTMYYVDWCPHCHHAKPEFDKLGPIQTIGGKKVLCSAIEAEKNPDAVAGKKISGYPTIQLYDPQGELVQEYSGARTESGFRSFLQGNLA
jgi:thiol-disulfide isomerase/thioredoxin